MSDATHLASVPLALVVCDMCGLPFGIPVAMSARLMANRLSVCCPSGHVRPISVQSPHATRIAQLELLVAEHAARLIAAREENAKLRATVVDRVVGPGTAPEAS